MLIVDHVQYFIWNLFNTSILTQKYYASSAIIQWAPKGWKHDKISTTAWPILTKFSIYSNYIFQSCEVIYTTL